MTTFCKDCQYSQRTQTGRLCGHPNAPRDPVEGNQPPCAQVRGDAFCGSAATWFVAAPKPK